jgi:hypothetical protein
MTLKSFKHILTTHCQVFVILPQISLFRLYILVIVDASPLCHQVAFQIGASTDVTRKWKIKVIFFVYVLFGKQFLYLLLFYGFLGCKFIVYLGLPGDTVQLWQSTPVWTSRLPSILYWNKRNYFKVQKRDTVEVINLIQAKSYDNN